MSGILASRSIRRLVRFARVGNRRRALLVEAVMWLLVMRWMPAAWK